jgi:hypothetical protein
MSPFTFRGDHGRGGANGFEGSGSLCGHFAQIAYKKHIFGALSAVDDAILVPALAFSVLQRCCWQEFGSAWKEATATSAPLV